MDKVRQIAADLSRALSWVLGREAPSTSRHMEGLQRLTKIFGEEVGEVMDDHVLPAQTSSTPTTRSAVREAPRSHSRTTRGNTPGRLPPIPPRQQ